MIGCRGVFFSGFRREGGSGGGGVGLGGIRYVEGSEVRHGMRSPRGQRRRGRESRQAGHRCFMGVERASGYLQIPPRSHRVAMPLSTLAELGPLGINLRHGARVRWM